MSRSERQREAERRYYERHRERVLERQRARRQDPEYRERRRIYQAAWRKANPDKVRVIQTRADAQRIRPAGRHRERHLRRFYHRTVEWFEATMAAQDNACAICRKSTTRVLSVDHDHACCPGERSCGECVRGLLCVICNRMLAALEDDEWREKAEQYIARHKH